MAIPGGAFGQRVPLQPTNLQLIAIIDALLSSCDVVRRAHAENVLMEQRVGADRQARYEAGFPPSAPTDRAWRKSHGDYLQSAVFLDLPETFLAPNAEAALPPAVTSTLGDRQVLVRVESLDYVLTHTKVNSIDSLMTLLTIYKGDDKHDRIDPGDAKALLAEVCRSLNENPYAVRPRFGAFAQELEGDIDRPDWAERLRDRLGLAHFPPAGKYGPHPVALMRYTVADVMDRARRVGAVHPLTVPTVLDGEPYEVFHPSPRGENYGRTLNLAGTGNCDRLASELLHLRIDYQPTHIWKVGAITTRAALPAEKLVRLRADHLFCLQMLSGRDDFGKL
jgi:hypothetical protein